MRRLFIILPVCLLVFAIAFFAVRRGENGLQLPGAPSPTPYGLETVNSFEGLVPGKSNEAELLSRIGKPESVVNKGTYQTYIFPSNNLYWKNEISVFKQSVVFIKERLFPPAEQAFTVLSKRIQGVPIKLFGPEHDSGFFLYAYPASGVAYFVHAPKDLTYEVWRFEPTTAKDMLLMPEFAGYGVTPSNKME